MNFVPTNAPRVRRQGHWPDRSLLSPVLRQLVFPLIEATTRSRFWSNYRRGVSFDHLGDRQRHAVTDRRLHDLLAVAAQSALYRRRLTEAGLLNGAVAKTAPRALLEQLAPAGKEVYRRDFPDGVACGAPRPDWRYTTTSGTLDRMTVVTDFAKRDYLRSSELRVLQTALGADISVPTVEVPPNACNAVCGLIDTAPQTLRGYLWHLVRSQRRLSAEARSDLRGRFERRVVLPRTTLPPIEPAAPAQLVEVLDSLLGHAAAAEPLLLRAYPVYLVWLADRLRATGKRLPTLRRVFPFGGMASPAMVARCEAGFGVPFTNVYGTSELGSAAASCGRSPGMHIFEDQFIFEVLRDGRPVAPGEIGRLVVTDLTNRAMPLIRYDIGDAGRLLGGPCPCGRRTARLEVLGRVQEVLDAPNGPLPATAVADAFFADPAVANFRLEESSPGAFDLTLVAGPAGSAPQVEACKERFAALHGAVGRLRARVAAFIRPESSGKYRFVHPCTGTRAL